MLRLTLGPRPLPPVSWAAPGAATHVCAPGMALILEVQVLYRPMAGTVSQGQLRHREVGWRGSRRQNSELTNGHRDTRPVRWGNPAEDGDAQRPIGHAHR